MNFCGGSVEGIVNFIAYTHDFHFPQSLYSSYCCIVYNAQLTCWNRSLCSLDEFWNFLQRENFRCMGHATTSINRGKTCRRAAVHAPSCFAPNKTYRNFHSARLLPNGKPEPEAPTIYSRATKISVYTSWWKATSAPVIYTLCSM